MKRCLAYFLCALVSACSVPVDTTRCASLQPVFSAPEGWQIFSTNDDQVLLFRGGLNVKADGAPNAYHPDEARGIAKLAQAGHPGNWWGLVTDTGKRSGKPIVQGHDDPSPGYFVSPTSLFHSDSAEGDPRRYVDALKTPYIALPANSVRTQTFWRARGMMYGDFAMVYDAERDRMRGAIFADAGTDDSIGEGSLLLADQFGLEATPHSGNRHIDRFVYVLFPRSGNGRPRTLGEIKQYTDELIQEWGGKKRLNTCANLLAHL